MKKILLASAFVLGLAGTANASGLFYQGNNAAGNGAYNTATSVGAGVQGNLFVNKATNNVESVGAVSGVSQVNNTAILQENTAVGNGALNEGVTYAIGVQGNALVNRADQDVLAIGAQSSVDSTNRNGVLQVNTAGGNFATNEARTGALGVQLNGGVYRASNDVTAVGASAGVDQVNRNGAVQSNLAGGNYSSNYATTAAVGGQLNVGVNRASQNVSAAGAVSSVGQTNR